MSYCGWVERNPKKPQSENQTGANNTAANISKEFKRLVISIYSKYIYPRFYSVFKRMKYWMRFHKATAPCFFSLDRNFYYFKFIACSSNNLFLCICVI